MRTSTPNSAWCRPKSVHMVGICGVGMSALARLYRRGGSRVSGSDLQRGAVGEALVGDGIPVSLGHQASHLPDSLGLLVVSAAISEQNPERRAALRRGVPVVLYAQALGALVAQRRSVAVAGAHGKTGTAALLLHVLEGLGREPGGVIGGTPLGRSHGAYLGSGVFVVEACEYQGSFLHLHPACALITSIDWDHPDCYRSPEDALEAFRSFAGGVRGPVLCDEETAALLCDCPGVEPLDGAVVVEREGRQGLRLRAGSFQGVRPCAAPVGHFLAQARLAATYLLRHEGADPEEILHQLAGFRGVQRRLQRLDKGGPVTVIDDYAHHPREILATHAAVSELFPGRPILAVFQPHQAARTRRFLEEFVQALRPFDRLILAASFQVAGREDEVAGDDVDQAGRKLFECLRSQGRAVDYGPDLESCSALARKSVRAGDVVLVMGAGDVGRVARDVVDSLC